MKKIILSLAAGLVLMVSAAHCEPPESTGFFFHDGDRPVVFLGDSITAQYRYTLLIEAYIDSRFPKWNVSFNNLGWGGDTVIMIQHGGLDRAMQRDILPLKPVAATIDFGMNDARAGEPALKGYVANTIKLVERLKTAGVRVALITPSPEERYETNQPAGSAYNRILWKYSQALEEAARKEDVPFVDQYTPFVKVIEDGRKAGILPVSGTVRLIPDCVHPNFAGHLVMAAAILKGLRAPALVSRVAIDAATRKVTDAKACQVELLDGSDLTFRRLDEALPWPIPEEAQFVLKIPGFNPLDDLDRYDLQVTNLRADKYGVLIDDVKVGDFSKDALASGVNLALQAGPITGQGSNLWKAIGEKNRLVQDRWVNVQIKVLPEWLSGPEVEKLRQAECDRRDKIIAAKEKEIDVLRQPTPHVWKLVPVP